MTEEDIESKLETEQIVEFNTRRGHQRRYTNHPKPEKLEWTPRSPMYQIEGNNTVINSKPPQPQDNSYEEWRRRQTGAAPILREAVQQQQAIYKQAQADLEAATETYRRCTEARDRESNKLRWLQNQLAAGT
jgi:hypothetical protein